MSPMPRLGRKFSTLLLTALLILGAALTVFAPVAAQADEGNQTGGANQTDATNETDEGTDAGAGDGAGDGGGAGDDIPRTYTIRAQDTGCPDGADPCWDLDTLPVLPGDNVRVVVDLTPSAQPHNFHVGPPISEMTATETATVQEMTFQVPENFGDDDTLEYVCDVHPTTMVGTFVTPAALSAGVAETVPVPQMGLHFLAYWVGVIAFALLFIVYGATFFLFKYNETPATTDHFDRGKGEGARLEKRNAVILALLFAAVATAALIYVLS